MNDREWVEDLMLNRLGSIGKTEHGYQRIAYGDADWEGRELLASEMEKMGMTVRRDAVGNIIARYEGSDPSAPAVVSGSHSDTVPEGGTYDGSVGVIGAMCAMKRIHEKGITKRPLEIWVFAGHESSRFGFNHLGSKSMTGLSQPDHWAKREDIYGQTVEEVLKSRGYDIIKAKEAERDPTELYSFIEMHIEQGPVLEKNHLGVGIVTDIAAPIRFAVKLNGSASHSGTTPMDMRKDALVAASEVVLSVRRRCTEQMKNGIVGTVGRLVTTPGVINCIPGYAELWIDVRGRDYDLIRKTVEQIQEDARQAAEKEHVGIEIDLISEARPVHLDERLGNVIKFSAEKLNVPYTYMVGGGGHDAANITRIAPTSVIHIPCRDGISHAADEYCSIDDMMVGIDVLTDVLSTLADE